MKAARNKTIDFSVEEGKPYLSRCLRLSTAASLSEITDKTILGDSFSILPLLPKGFVDLLIVDPPYNLSKDFGGSRFRRLSDEEYEAYTERWIRAALPVLKPTASLYVCCDWESSLVIGTVLKKYFHVRNRITWQREKGRGAQKNWKNGMEDVWFATVSDDYAFHLERVMVRRKVLAPYRADGEPKDWEKTPQGNFRDTCPSNFWDDLSVPYWSMAENTAHPTQKPEKLLAKLILASSDPGDFVLDPFLGSGTTSVTAKKLGRHFCGLEQNEQYAAWAEKRLDMAEENAAIQGYEDGVFWERNSRPPRKK